MNERAKKATDTDTPSVDTKKIERDVRATRLIAPDTKLTQGGLEATAKHRRPFPSFILLTRVDIFLASPLSDCGIFKPGPIQVFEAFLGTLVQQPSL